MVAPGGLFAELDDLLRGAVIGFQQHFQVIGTDDAFGLAAFNVDAVGLGDNARHKDKAKCQH